MRREVILSSFCLNGEGEHKLNIVFLRNTASCHSSGGAVRSPYNLIDATYSVCRTQCLQDTLLKACESPRPFFPTVCVEGEGLGRKGRRRGEGKCETIVETKCVVCLFVCICVCLCVCVSVCVCVCVYACTRMHVLVRTNTRAWELCVLVYRTGGVDVPIRRRQGRYRGQWCQQQQERGKKAQEGRREQKAKGDLRVFSSHVLRRDTHARTRTRTHTHTHTSSSSSSSSKV